MIPHIVKGKGISGALKYALSEGFAEEKAEGTSNDNRERGRYKTLAEGEESRVTILGGQNFGFDVDSAERLELARRVMEWQALPENQGSKTRTQDLDCLHASLAWQPGYQPSREEMLQAGTEFLQAIGLEKARAVFIAHDDKDHSHIHVIASRIDPESGKTLRVDYDQAEAQAWAVRWEIAHGQERDAGKGIHALRSAVQGRDVDGVLDYLTRDKPTFEPWQINRALQYGGLDRVDREQFRAEIIGHDNTIGLRDTAQDPVTRYTTREALSQEMSVLRDAAQLAGSGTHGINRRRIEHATRDHTLKPEQADALRHLTGKEGFAILWGEAGTGKSHTLNAVRDAYEGGGRTVIGMSWTNQVVEQMRGDGFDQAATVASQLAAIDKGRAHWGSKTVLIVDEAAMLSTAVLKRLTTAAHDAGAKLIIAGDDAQLPSIERGGLFETLRQRHGAATLKEVQRVNDKTEQINWNAMHGGDFAPALKTYDERGAIHWADKQADTLKSMAADYVAARAESPEKLRFMFAYTNKDVATLNAETRALRQQRGEIDAGKAIQTAHGEQSFSKGDRIQFTANAWTDAEKRAGYVNGRVGTVEGVEIDGDGNARMTVALDTKAGSRPRSLTFTVGDDARGGEFNSFRHGYAGTIYRGQGATLDQAFVGHSAHWRSSAAYVALTRHRNDVHIYAARETVADVDALASAMSRQDGKRAATAYHIDAGELIDIAKSLDAAEKSAAKSRTTKAADVGETITRPGQRQAEPTPATPSATVAEAAESGIGQALGFVADYAEKAIQTLSDVAEGILGGGSPQPSPKQQQTEEPEPAATPAPPLSRHERFLAAEREQRQKTLDALKRDFGREVTEEEAKEIDLTLDRGGGQSL
jgi:hypothetical protein